MKKLVLVCTVFLMAASTSSAYEFLGPSTNPWQQGQWGVGFGYCYSNMNINVRGDRYFSHYGISGHLPQKLRIHKYYGTVGCGVSNNIGVYGLAGATYATSDIRVGGAPHGHAKMDFGYAPIYGFGVRSTLYRRGAKLQVGAMAQCSWVRDLSASRHIYSFQYAKANIDLMEMHIAAGPTYQLCPTTMIYGGPFLHFVRGDFRGKGLCSYCGITDDVTHDIQQGSWFGGNIGIQTKINNCISMMVEYMYTAQGDALGTGFFIPL